MSRPIKKAGFAQGLYEQSSTRKEIVGTLRITQDGRRFRYAKAGEALTAGNMGICIVETATLTDEVQTGYGASKGDYNITLNITAGGTLSVDDLKGGYLYINDNDIEGTIYEIAGNAALAVGDGTLSISLEDPLKEDLAVTAEVCIVASPWYGVTESTTEESTPAGVPLIDVTNAYYYWAQTGGLANVLMGGTPAVGTACVLSATSGAVTAPSATNDFWLKGRVGTKVYRTGVSGEYDAVMLNID